jgi:hypothetical protein
MTSTIKVNAFHVKPNGTSNYFGDETGTPEFYHVDDILKKYLGEDNIWVSWDYNNWNFIIEQRGLPDEACDNTYDYIKIIESIWEPFLHPPGIFEDYKKDHLAFQIVYDN